MQDFAIADYGSIVLIAPLSPAAREKVKEFSTESWQWLGDRFAVDHRIADDLIKTLHEEGFAFA